MIKKLTILEWLKRETTPSIKNYADGTKTLVLHDDYTETQIEVLLPVVLLDEVNEWIKK